MLMLLLIPMILVNTACSLFYKRTNKPPLTTLFAIAVWGIPIFGIGLIVTAFTVDNVFANLNLENFGWIFLKSILAVCCILCWAKGVKYVPASIAEPFTQSRMLILLGFSWLVFGDVVGYLGIILVAVIFISCGLLGFLQYRAEGQKNNSKNFAKGLFWLFGWIVFSTANVSVIRVITNAGIQVSVYSFLETIIFLIISIVFLLIKKNPLKKAFGDITRDINQIGIGITDNIWIFFYIPLAKTMNLGILDAIGVTAVALTVLGGVVLLKEKIRWYIYPLIAVIIGCSVALCLI